MSEKRGGKRVTLTVDLLPQIQDEMHTLENPGHLAKESGISISTAYRILQGNSFILRRDTAKKLEEWLKWRKAQREGEGNGGD